MKRLYEVVVECEIVEAFEIEAESEEEARHIAECRASRNWDEVHRAKAVDAYTIDGEETANA